MAPRMLTKVLAALTLGAAALTIPAQDTASAEGARADLLASANASDVAPQQFDRQADTARLGRGGHARSTSTASALCPGCQGEARTVQVVYVERGDVAADNVAAAWASCAGCRASSLAIQVVVLRGNRPGTVVVTNRALAVNAACQGCATQALAVQFVLSGGNGERMSGRVRALLDNLGAQLGEDLGVPSPKDRRSVAPQTAPQTARETSETPQVRAVADALEKDLGGSVEVHVEDRQG